MRTLIVADIHSNLEALQAVVADAQRDGPIDAVWSLGDVVGYGPQPNECIALLCSYPVTGIAGNHDLAALGLIGLEEFNPFAAVAAEWTAEVVNDDSRAWLSTLNQTLETGDFTLVHGALTNPVWDYLMSARDAGEHLKLQGTSYSLVGHSHLPLQFWQSRRGIDGRPLQHEATIELDGTRFVANPGSVGQPRDGDPRAAYAVLDSGAELLSFYRVPYDVGSTQAKIMAAGLPAYLAERLEQGR